MVNPAVEKQCLAGALALMVVIALSLSGEAAARCTAIGVGKKASVDGSVMVAHTDDAGDGTSDLRLVRVPARDHEPGSMRPIYRVVSGYPRLVDAERSPDYGPQSGQQANEPMGYINEVNHTYAYWDQLYGVINEHQLVIAESTCGARTVGFPLNDKVHGGKALFGIEELSKIALERCVTARCAAKTMGDLAVEYGFYAEGDKGDGGEGLFLGDKTGELWAFHVLPSPDGAHAIWAAQRIPDDSVVAMANDFVIQDMDLNDHDNNMYSSNMVHIALKEGWFSGSLVHHTINFFKTFGYEKPKDKDPLMGLYSGRRMWRVYSILNAEYNATGNPYIGYMPSTADNYPPYVKPDNKVCVRKIFKILGDHYEGTQFDMTKGLAAGPFNNPNRFEGQMKGEKVLKGGFERPISIYRGTFSIVSQSSQTLPDMLGVTWYGQDQPSGSVWVPVYAGQLYMPESYLWGKQSEFSLDSSWWAFNFVNNWMQLGYSKMLKDVNEARARLQNQACALHHMIVENALKEDDAEVAIDLITENSNKFANHVVEEWWQFAFKLIAKYSNGLITTGEGETQRAGVGYPNWWLKSVGYESWPPKNPAEDSSNSIFFNWF